MRNVRCLLLSLVLPAALLAPGCKDKGDPSSAAPDEPMPVSPFATKVTEASSAPKPPGKVAKAFDDTDLNHDGKVTREEARQFADKKFKDLDKNGDEVLDEDELSAEVDERMEAAAKERLSLLDRNNDGKVAREELPPPLLERFEKLDTNGDGFVTAEDMRGNHAKGRMHPSMSPIARLDTDGDGKVSLGEYTYARIEWFSRADRNGDDAVTLEEAENAVPAHMAPGGLPGGPPGGLPGGPRPGMP